MSLYYLQKILYQINRDPTQREIFLNDPSTYVASFELDEEERDALLKPDVGLLYVLGVNGQILMHFAAAHEISWDDYMEMMRIGLREHGPVRAGVYAATGYEGLDAHESRLSAERTKATTSNTQQESS